MTAEKRKPEPVGKTFPVPCDVLNTSGCVGTSHASIARFTGVDLAQYDTFWGKRWRLMGFDSQQVGGGLGFLPFFFLKGTVFGQWRNTANLVIMVAISYAVCFSIEYDTSDNGPPTLNMTATSIKAIWMEAMPIIQVLVAFQLAGFISQQLAKWQTKRGLYGKLVGRSRDAVMKIACMVELKDESTQRGKLVMEGRMDMGRYVSLAMEFAILKARGAMDDEELSKPFLEERGLLKPGEWDFLVPGDRHTTVYYWILCWAKRLKAEGVLSENEFLLIAEIVSDVRGVANDLLDLLPNGFPFSYVQLVNFSTKIFIFMVAVNAGFGMADKQWQFPDAKPPAIFWIVYAVVLWGCHASFQGLLDLQYILHNPFLGDISGVAHEPIVYGQIGTFTDHMVRGKCRLPRLTA